MKRIWETIVKKNEGADTLLTLVDQLSGSQLNSLLLAFFQKLARKVQPTDLVKQWHQNRFVFPAKVDAIQYLTLELDCLKMAQVHSFIPVILSPLTPLGTCSVVGEVDQSNVVSALRGTEVVSDATNVLAIRIAAESKKQSKPTIIRYATTHRHVRGQYFTNPAYTAHFGVFCLVSGGMDTGSFAFELQQLSEHLKVHMALLASKLDLEALFIKVYLRKENSSLEQLVQAQLSRERYPFQLIKDYQKGDYYQRLQFKIFYRYKGMELDLADGGTVDWTQQMIPNQKHRLFISGCGLELLEKILEGQL